MSEFNKISELVQKFGLISGKKQIFKTVQSFLDGFEKAYIAACVTREAGGRCVVNINSRGRLEEQAFLKLAEALEPFMARYFFNDARGPIPAMNFSDFVDFEHHEASHDAPSGARLPKNLELKGSMVIPVFLENKVYSLFALFATEEFELTRQELLAVNIVAHMTAISLKSLAVNQKVQKMANELKREKVELTEKVARLTRVVELSHMLVSLDSYEKLLAATVDSYRRAFGVEQIMVLGINHHKNELFVEHCTGFYEDFAASFKLPCGYGLIGAVIEKNEPYFRKNIIESSEELAVIPFCGVSGLVCGAIVLYDKFNRLEFGDDEYELMWMLANFFALALNMIKVQSVSGAFEKTAAPQTPAAETNGAGAGGAASFERPSPQNFASCASSIDELADEARRVLSPASLVDSPKISMAYEYMQAENCGADLIAAFKTAGNCVTVAVADVSGRGARAALSAAMLRAQLKTVCAFNGELRKIMFDLNNFVCEDIAVYDFITLFLLQISPNGARAAFSSAGHCPVIHYINDGANAVVHESRNSPLGVIKNTDFKEGMLILGGGDVLLLYTNGLAEARAPGGEPFGRQRLCEIIKNAATLDCVQIKEAISSAVRAHTAKTKDFDDDIAFVVIKVG